MDEGEVIVKMAMHAWNTNIGRVGKLIDSMSDDQLMKEIAPGRNRGIYLLGHLIAVNETMIPIFGLGEKLYPELETIFIATPDKSGLEMPILADLRKYWSESNKNLLSYFDRLTPGEWLQKHNLMSQDDFIKDPKRNKLSVLINRTNHVAYHFGQMVLIPK